MFSKSAQYYDEILAANGKDYAMEVEIARKTIQKHKKTDGKLLLDVACGTGIHAEYLSKYYKVEGIDLDEKMLAVARKKQPKIKFTKGDMLNFDMSRQFDIVVCLFSSIGYMKTRSRLTKAVKTMSTHLLPGGVLLVEPWFTPQQWTSGRIFTIHVEKPKLKIARMSHSTQKGNVSYLEFQYLVGTSKGIKHNVETHTLGLFTHEEYLNAFHLAGLKTTHDKNGLDGRGLYIGRKTTK
jgi:ubiquinone/menaquinone biosynthesis C-methylase UbiE